MFRRLAIVLFALSILSAQAIPAQAETNQTPTLITNVTGVAQVPCAQAWCGYWTVNSEGVVSPTGPYAPKLGGVSTQNYNAPIIGIAATNTGRGYWLVTANGDVIAFGDAEFYGSMYLKHLDAPIVGITPTWNDEGYWLVGKDGGVFAFGNARFLGREPLDSTVGIASLGYSGGYVIASKSGSAVVFQRGRTIYLQLEFSLNKPIVAVVADPATLTGFWLVAADGGVFALDGAPFIGTLAHRHLFHRIVSASATLDGRGLTMVDTSGSAFYIGTANPTA